MRRKNPKQNVQILFQNEVGSWDHKWDERDRAEKLNESWEESSQKGAPASRARALLVWSRAGITGHRCPERGSAIIKENHKGGKLKWVTEQRCKGIQIERKTNKTHLKLTTGTSRNRNSNPWANRNKWRRSGGSEKPGKVETRHRLVEKENTDRNQCTAAVHR